MTATPALPQYVDLLTRFLADPDDLARERVLMEIDALSRSLLPREASVDDLLGLHTRAQARIADDVAMALPGTPAAQTRQQLARGDAMPALLALLLPQQIEDQRRAELRWQAEYARMAAAFDQTEDLVVMLDDRGRVEFVNPAFTRATGWNLDQLRARPEAFWPEGIPSMHAIERMQPRADGGSFPAQWSVSPIVDEQDQARGHVCIGRDVGRQQQIEDAIRQVDRLRAVATLAAGIAHDFNNVLGSIQGLTEVCLAQVEGDAPVVRNLEGIRSASERAAGLIAQLLSFSRAETPRRTSLNVDAWLDEIGPLLGASLPKGVTLELAVDPSIEVQVDAAQLEQVVLNLVKNAGYAMRATGGQVTLAADRWIDDGGVRWNRLRVIDHGEGIPPDILPRIFDPFFSTKPVDAGTGLGLSSAHGIARQHGGRLAAQSKPGGPTVFTLLLPDEAAVRPAAGNAVPVTGSASIASWYEVDADDRIIAVSDDWDRFAVDNDGARAVSTVVIGRALTDFIAGQAQRRYMLDLLALVRLTSTARHVGYECNSPTLAREIDMLIEPRPAGVVRVSHRTVSLSPLVRGGRRAAAGRGAAVPGAARHA